MRSVAATRTYGKINPSFLGSPCVSASERNVFRGTVVPSVGRFPTTPLQLLRQNSAVSIHYRAIGMSERGRYTLGNRSPCRVRRRTSVLPCPFSQGECLHQHARQRKALTQATPVECSLLTCTCQAVRSMPRRPPMLLDVPPSAALCYVSRHAIR